MKVETDAVLVVICMQLVISRSEITTGKLQYNVIFPKPQ